MPADAQRPVSGRIELARLAEQVIAVTDRVQACGYESRWITADGDRAIDGVIAAENGLGQVELELHLDALWPPEPLDRLSVELRRRLRRSATLAGLGDRLGALQIHFHDIIVPEEPAAP